VGYDARPSAVKNFLAYSLTRLGLDHIDIYRPSRLDPNVPIEDTISAIADLVKAGYVRYVGLSEVGPRTIRRAQAVHPISVFKSVPQVVEGPGQAFSSTRELSISVTILGVLSRTTQRLQTGGEG
jgi:aryl-alcohol dehydrogenase-like predicted oxidoreductase